jgi:hypothetical protein
MRASGLGSLRAQPGSAAMDDEISRDDIARIEEQIEALREAIARCGKISLAAKIAIGAGAAWLVLTLLSLAPFVPFMLVGAMAAVIGGIVLLGSNATTWTQTEAQLRASEAMRAEWIAQLDLRVVDQRPRLH